MSSFNVKNQVPNDINISKNYISSQNFQTESHLATISDWTERKLNIKKTNYMIFNFTNNHQFNTRININEEPIAEKEKLNFWEQ